MIVIANENEESMLCAKSETGLSNIFLKIQLGALITFIQKGICTCMCHFHRGLSFSN